MFDSVLQKSSAAKPRFGAGTMISVALHGMLFGLIVWLPTAGDDVADESPAPLKFFARAPTAPTMPALAQAARPAVAKKHRPRLEAFVRQQAVAEAPPAPVEEDDADDTTGADDDAPTTGPSGDDVGGLIDDGQSKGPPSGGSGVDVLAFGEGMTRPECDKSVLSDLYSRSREAREARIEGTMVVQCSIMADGSVQACRVLKPLAHLSELALAAMTSMSCKPATFQGKPVSIRYVQNLQFALPR